MNEDARRILKHFLRIAAITAVPVLALLLLLGGYVYNQAYETALELHRAGLHERARGIELIAKSAHDTVAETQAMAADALSRAGEFAPSPRMITLDTRPDPGPAKGFLAGPPALAQSEEARRAIAAAETLWPRMQAASTVWRDIRWSYVFDGEKRFVMIYPWADARSFWPGPDWEAEFRKFFDYDIFRMATPAANAKGEAYWTPVYFDAGGSGLMVSHGAPVMADGKFLAMAGADVLLSSLSTSLASFEALPGTFVVADQNGIAVADVEGRAAAGKDVVAAKAILGAALEEAAAAPAFAAAGGDLVSSRAIAGTPWTLYHVTPQASIRNAALASLLPFAATALGLLLALAGLYAAIRRAFVQPAIQLAGVLADPGKPQETPMPAHWQALSGRVTTAFAENAKLIDEVRAAEATSSAVINAALDAVVIADGEGRVTGFNPAAERMFGFSAAEAIGRPLTDTIVPPVHHAAHDAGMKRFRATGDAHVIGRRVELEARRADGVIIPVEISIHKVDIHGRELFAAYLRDLSMAKESARQIEDQRNKLHQSEKLSAMGSLLAGVAHELNNPLAIVVAQASLMEEKARGDMKLRAEKIHAAAERCARIVKSFLAMVRQKPPAREAVDLNGLASGVGEMLGYGLKSAGVGLVKDFDQRLPRIAADKDLFNQVIANLVLNAQQALSDRPEPRTIWLRTEAAEAGAILEVADNGPGVPADALPRIFDPYFTTKPAGVGTGIGLAICRNVVQAHGGRIEYLDRKGGGAVFRIFMPATEAEAASGRVRKIADGGKLSILIVDDDADVGDTLGDMLASGGHQITMALSGEEAMEKIAGGGFDTVFTDLRMPGMNGVELRRRILAHDPALGARTVIVTGDTVTGPVAIKAAAGESEPLWMEKPFMRADVSEMLERLRKL